MKYQLGDNLWHATFDAADSSVVCPDCNGEGRIRCLMHDDTMVSVECETCRRGYEGSTGRVYTYDRSPKVRPVEITGIEIMASKIEYRTSDSHIVQECDLFKDRDDAMKAAQAKVEEANKEELDRIATKEKPTRSWAWNASYHRRCIKDAQRQIEYHSSKLAVASLKAKEKADA